MEMELFSVQVGKKFPSQDVLEKLMNGQDGASLNYNSDEKLLSLYVTLANPMKKEVSIFRKDLLRFALYRNHLLNTSIIMMYIGTELVFDLIYDINLLDLNTDGEIEGNRFTMYLLNSNTGIVEAIRAIGLGRNFVKEINQIIKNDGRYSSKEFEAWLNNDVLQKSLPELWSQSERIDWDK